MREIVRERAPAKVNLALAVTGRRPDGYHLLDTLVVFAEAGDRVDAALAEGLGLTIDGRFADRLGATADNLVIRAARLLADDARKRGHDAPGARLHLTKALPVAAGLGGGSADAAAALRALNRLWRLGYRPAQLAELGTRLGADVAMCTYSRALRARGVGEEIMLLDALPPLPMVLANPGVDVVTREVFAAREAGFSPPLPELRQFADTADMARWLGRLGNDLESPARRLAPAIDEVLSALRQVPDCLVARMSGSGATCFAIFPDDAAAARAADKLTAARPGWWVQATTVR